MKGNTWMRLMLACALAGSAAAATLSWERRAGATACSLLDLTCYCEADSECTSGSVYGCVGVPVREMPCGTAGATCMQFVGCQGFTNQAATLCALSGPQYRCSNHPSNGGSLQQYSADCQDCTGCYDKLDSFQPCGSGTICWYPNGTDNDAECGTLAGVTSFDVVHEGTSNIVTWSTGTERNNMGFNVYLVGNDGDVVRKVNDRLVPGAMKTPVGEVYRLADPAGRPGDQYELEWIDHDGLSHKRGPVAAIEGVAGPFARRFDPAAIRKAATAKLASLKTPGVITSALTSGDCTGVRISVADTGIYRVPVADVTAAGLDLAGATAAQVSITSGGVPVPFGTSTTSALSATDWIEFYGRASDSPLSATSVYVLSLDQGFHAAMDEGDASPVADEPFAPWYEAAVRFEKNVEYALTPAIDDFFYWAYVYYGDPVKEFTLDVKSPAPGADTFGFRVDLDGISDNIEVDKDHHHQVLFNGNLVKDFQWDGVGLHSVEADLPAAWLVPGENKVVVKTIEEEGNPYDMVAVDGFTITYRREFTAADGALSFDYEGDEPNVAVGGFAGADVRVYDVTDPGHPVLLKGVDVKEDGGAWTASFSRPDPTKKGSFLVLANERLMAPKKIVARFPSDIRSADKGADLLVIAYDAFVPALQPLVDLRESQGLRVEVVATSEVYDEFGHGAVSDRAIKDFIVFAADNWQAPAPRSVLLVGDSTNDPRDYLGLGLVNYVPSHPLQTGLWGGTTSDNWYVDLDDSGDFDLAIGRLSVSTPDEATAAVDKIIAYEKGGQTAGSDRVILIADSDRDNLGKPFEDVLAAMEAVVPALYDVVSIRVDDFASVQDARAKVKAELDKGSLLVVYVGHGSGLSWGGDPVFEAKDVQALPEGVHEPLAVSLSCVNGYFTYPGLDILGEAFVKPPDRGAIASWMPGDMGFPSRHKLLIESFVKNLFDEAGVLSGEAVRRALNELAASGGDYDQSIAQTFVYLGDPTMQLHTIESGLEGSAGGGCAGTGSGTVGLLSVVAVFLGFAAIMILRRRRAV